MGGQERDAQISHHVCLTASVEISNRECGNQNGTFHRLRNIAIDNEVMIMVTERPLSGANRCTSGFGHNYYLFASLLQKNRPKGSAWPSTCERLLTHCRYPPLEPEPNTSSHPTKNSACAKIWALPCFRGLLAECSRG